MMREREKAFFFNRSNKCRIPLIFASCIRMRVYIPRSLLEASWNLVGSKTFGIYLAKWRHPSWKWPVRHTPPLCRGGEMQIVEYLYGMVHGDDLHGGVEPLGRRLLPYFFSFSNAKWNSIRSGVYPFAILLSLYRPTREFRESGNVWLYREMLLMSCSNGASKVSMPLWTDMIHIKCWIIDYGNNKSVLR